MSVIRRVRDAITGRFTTKRAARAHPATTITETVRMTNQRGKPHMAEQTVTFENLSNPGQPIHGGDNVRASVPTDPKGKNVYIIASYPQEPGGISTRVPYYRQLDEIAGACSFTLDTSAGNDPVADGDNLMAYLKEKTAGGDRIGLGSYVIGAAL